MKKQIDILQTISILKRLGILHIVFFWEVNLPPTSSYGKKTVEKNTGGEGEGRGAKNDPSVFKTNLK